ncbi:MAG TPA: right-handed parallel beta-helix repeat-containing protein [Bacteroidales bacterium]|nr:right-handed parallel beta-helix repeat-containing protein [Bacteroidales bacterium]
MMKKLLLQSEKKSRQGGLFVLLILLSISTKLNAQPSGGPYGPVTRNYAIPEVSGTIYYAAPDGSAEAPGISLEQPGTLETILEKVKTGDAVILRGGTYRTGDLVVNQGITIQPYADEQPVLKGTLPATDWKRIGRSLWKTKWDHLFQAGPDSWWSRDRHGKETPLHIFNNDMVFVDGKLLNSAGWEGEVDENSFYIDYESGFVYIGTDPDDHLVEITAHSTGLRRSISELNGKPNDHKGLILKGITLTQYAFCALYIDGHTPNGLADPSTFGKDVVGSHIENCTFSYCGRVGAHLKGDSLVMKSCSVHHTTTEGVFLMSSSDCLLEKNKFSQNNIENISGYYPAAVKIFNQTRRVTCRDNLIYDLPLSNGIWYDVGNVDGRFLNNWVMNVGSNSGPGSGNHIWPGYNGFMFEISKGAVCAGNVFVNCDHGIMVLNSSNVEIYQNTFVNSTACIARDKRSAVGDHFGWHPTTGPDVDERYGHVFVNNLLTGDKNFIRPLMLVWQDPDLCEKLNESPLKQYDHNVYVRDKYNGFPTLVYWSPSPEEHCQSDIRSLTGLQQVFKGSSKHSQVFESYNMPLFKSAELYNFQLNKNFPAKEAGAELPAEFRKLLELPKGYEVYVGAYPGNVTQ